MKKLIIILFLLPLLGVGQYISNPSYNQDNYAFELNGVDNYIDFNLKTYADTIKIKTSFLSLSNFDWVISYSSSITERYGIGLNGSKELVIRHGSEVFNTSIIPTLNLLYELELRRDSINDSITIIVNNTAYGFNTTTDLTTSNLAIAVGAYAQGTSNFTEAKIYDFIFIIKGVIYQYPILEGYSNKIYDVSGNNNHGTIYGTLVNQWQLCPENNYNELYGVTKVKYGSQFAYIPYLSSGLPLYPSVSPVINAGEKYINYPTTYWKPKMIVK